MKILQLFKQDVYYMCVMFSDKMAQDEVQGTVETVCKDLRQMRACLMCSLVKVFDQVT